MKFVINFLTQIFKKEVPKQLGRWNIDYCHKKINTKIDYSNEDHCGPCGNYSIKNKEQENKEERK